MLAKPFNALLFLNEVGELIDLYAQALKGICVSQLLVGGEDPS